MLQTMMRSKGARRMRGRLANEGRHGVLAWHAWEARAGS